MNPVVVLVVVVVLAIIFWSFTFRREERRHSQANAFGRPAASTAANTSSSSRHQPRIPQTSERGSALILGAIGQALEEFGPSYARTGLTISRDKLLFIPYITMMQELGFLVDWLLMDEHAEFAVDEASRNEAIANIAPMWEDFFGTDMSALAYIDCVFRVSAMALHNADASQERKTANVWFDAASIQLARIEQLTSGAH